MCWHVMITPGCSRVRGLTGRLSLWLTSAGLFIIFYSQTCDGPSTLLLLIWSMHTCTSLCADTQPCGNTLSQLLVAKSMKFNFNIINFNNNLIWSSQFQLVDWYCCCSYSEPSTDGVCPCVILDDLLQPVKYKQNSKQECGVLYSKLSLYRKHTFSSFTDLCINGQINCNLTSKPCKEVILVVN